MTELRVGLEVEIEGFLDEKILDDANGSFRWFKVRADPHWYKGVFRTGVNIQKGDVPGRVKMRGRIVSFCDEPNRGLMVVDFGGNRGRATVPCVAVDGPPDLEE